MPALDPGAANDVARGAARRRKIVGRLAQFAVGALTAATVIAGFARAHWIADLATHFPLQYAAVSLVAAVAMAWARLPAWALLAVALAGFNAHKVLGPDPERPSATTGSQPFRLLVVNVFYANAEHGRVLAYVRATRPDAAVFVEVTPSWRAALRTLERELPFASAMPGRRHGVLVLSRWPITSAEALMLAPGGDPLVRASLAIGARPLELIGVHAAWPLGARNSSIRNRQLESLAALAASSRKPLLIAGDFNTTIHSPHFADLLERGELISAAHDRRWAPTWPTFFLPAGIQIDHVLVSEDVGVSRFDTGPAVGSDHLPIVVDLLL